MSKYPEVVGQLVSAAYDQGMSKQTQVYAVADGGNGRSRCTSNTVSEFNIYPRPFGFASSLRRETRLQDWTHRPHLKQHLYSGAEAMGLTDVERHKWVSNKLYIIDAGDVRHVIRILKEYHGQGKERITNLSEYQSAIY